MPDEDWVRAVGYDLQAPRVIRLVSCDRGPRQGLRFNRRNV
ncbi:MAG: HNH endonuclease, partial [Planctomycetia bacterium]|nr:HNH endonuclease [Planctomycetia bacterium]